MTKSSMTPTESPILTTFASVAVTLILGAGPVSAQTTQRPISEFVDAQGTYCLDDGMGGCVVFVPPVQNFIGWTDPASGLAASVDYAGLADDWITTTTAGAMTFNTQTSGSVTERVLADGRAEITVRLFTNNALMWLIQCCDFGSAPTIFGNRAPDVLLGENAVLGWSFLHVAFTSPAPGLPLPDLLQIAFDPQPGQEFRRLQFVANASGLMDDGTPASLHITQTGLLDVPSGAAAWDGFPVESIRLTIQGGPERRR